MVATQKQMLLFPSATHLLCDLHMKDSVQSKLSYLNFNITAKDEAMCDVFRKRLGDYVKNVQLIQSLLKNLTTWLLKSKDK